MNTVEGQQNTIQGQNNLVVGSGNVVTTDVAGLSAEIANSLPSWVNYELPAQPLQVMSYSQTAEQPTSF